MTNELINTWLASFKKSWQTHDVDAILNLFDSNIEYYETPFLKLDSLDAIRKEWEPIVEQKNIALSFEVFSKMDNKYTVIWDLAYTAEDGEKINLKGTCLIELNNGNKCVFFHQTCEAE
jgi:hypothetical protein